MSRLFSFFILVIVSVGILAAEDNCKDTDGNCRDWVTSDKNLCSSTEYIQKSCRRSCGFCIHIPEKFDLTKVPSQLQPIAWLIGIWRSEHGGKAVFPTIPKFTYGEQIEFALSDPHATSKSLNYTAFAWGINDHDELHSETGYITVREGTNEVAMTTVMNNGFVTVEEGPARSGSIRFRLVDIGRISFSRDLPVHDLIREWTLLDSSTMQARLDMETLTHGMQEHTFIRYKKVFP
uniref:ShKT domain-containing protein n=1 Tax=Panagrellus redivivus TaxID=6233 RepID=A0A7E4VXW6_PANRE